MPFSWPLIRSRRPCTCLLRTTHKNLSPLSSMPISISSTCFASTSPSLPNETNNTDPFSCRSSHVKHALSSMKMLPACCAMLLPTPTSSLCHSGRQGPMNLTSKQEASSDGSNGVSKLLKEFTKMALASSMPSNILFMKIFALLQFHLRGIFHTR